MAFSRAPFTSKSPGDTIPVPFPFLSRDHIHISVGEAEVGPEHWSWLTDGLIQVGSGFPSGAGQVYRVTPRDVLPSTLTGAAVFDFEGTNLNDRLALYTSQEVEDYLDEVRILVEGLDTNVRDVVQTSLQNSAEALQAANSALGVAGSASSAAQAAATAAADSESKAEQAQVDAASAAQAAAVLAAAVTVTDAASLPYDDASSGIGATNVQEAVDLLAQLGGASPITTDTVSLIGESGSLTQKLAAIVTALSSKAPAAHGHAMEAIDGLVSALSAKAPASHGHAMDAITGLASALAGKAAATHGHQIGDVAGLSAALATAANGRLKALVNFDGTGTVAIRSQLNVSSVTDLGTGTYRVNFVTPMSTAAAYIITGSCWAAGAQTTAFNVAAQAAGYFEVYLYSTNAAIGAMNDRPMVSAAVYEAS